MASVKPLLRSRLSTQPLEKIPSQSSFIAAFEYDEANSTLTTFMKNGAIYQHKDVDPLEWGQLKTAKNDGKHWSKNIKGQKLSVRVKAFKTPRSH